MRPDRARRVLAFATALIVLSSFPAAALAYPPDSLVLGPLTVDGKVVSAKLDGLVLSTSVYKVFDDPTVCSTYKIISSFSWSKAPQVKSVNAKDPDACGIHFSLQPNYT